MTHSHLPLQHLIKHLDEIRGSRDPRPEWLTDMIDCVSELFEPLQDVARVGFDCALSDDRWEVGMYLGKTEKVGGADDGCAEFVNFQFDLSRLLRAFNLVERCEWNAIPQWGEADFTPDASSILVEGYWEEHPVRLLIYAAPPEQAGPGLRHFPDGSWEPV